MFEFYACSEEHGLVGRVVEEVEKGEWVVFVLFEGVEELFALFDDVGVGLRHQVECFLELCLH